MGDEDLSALLPLMDAASALLYSELSSTFDLAQGYKAAIEESPARASSTTSFTSDSTASDSIQLVLFSSLFFANSYTPMTLPLYCHCVGPQSSDRPLVERVR